MSKVTYEIIEKDDRLYFYDGKQYVLFDSGFTPPSPRWSASVSGTIGPFAVNRQFQAFFSKFIDVRMENGEAVGGVFNCMDGYDCLLEGNTLTVSDEGMDCPEYEYFFDFVHPMLPLLEGELNGRRGLFFFDSGARMTMIMDRAAAAAEPIRSYREWMGALHVYEELSVFPAHLAFPNGFSRGTEGALVTDPFYTELAASANVKAMLGIDIFKDYDLFFALGTKRRGIALLKKKEGHNRPAAEK